MALPSFSAAIARVAATMNNIWTPPWSGLSHILFGPDSSSSSSSRSRRSARRHRRSRSCPRMPSAIRSSIPPPHSYVFRGREMDTDAAGQAPYPPFFFQSGVYDRAFGYSILDREADSRTSGRDNRRSRCPLEEDREKNFLSALLSILVIATLATALTQPKWFSVRGGACGRKFVGLQLFIEFGSQVPGPQSTSRNEPLPQPQSVFGFDSPSYPDTLVQDSADGRKNQTSTHVEDVDDKQVVSPLPNSIRRSAVPKTGSRHENASSGADSDSHRSSTPKKWSSVAGHVRKACSFSDIVPLQRGIILFSLMAIVANLVQFFLDTLGTSKKWLDSVRLYALGSIFGVIFTIFIIGISYMIATVIEVNEKSLIATASKEPIEVSHLEVRFELSYYLVTLSGLIGLLAAACNLLRKPTMYFLSSADGRNPLIDFYPRSGSAADEPLSPIWSGSLPGGASVVLPPIPMPPPPPYSP